MSDDLVCSDLCEENGYTRQAEILRAIAGDRPAVYVVMERGAEYNDEIMDPKKGGDPRSAFLDRAEAERVAAERNARWHRENNILGYCYSLDDVTSYPEAELERRISEILGRPFRLPNEDEDDYDPYDGPLVPGAVTDEQMRKIADLFTLKFFYVVETHFAERGGVLPFGEGASPGEGQR